jgi:hypothetical protein
LNEIDRISVPLAPPPLPDLRSPVSPVQTKATTLEPARGQLAETR